MSFFKRLFGGKKKVVEPMRGGGMVQTTDQQSSTRTRMEADMERDRERRAGSPAAAGAPSPSVVDREEAVIALVTTACGGMDLQTARVDVNKLGGGTAPTLRFTLEGSASTDLEIGRIMSGDETPEALAIIVVAEGD